MSELTQIVLDSSELSNEDKIILGKIQESFSNADTATIEDYMSEVVDLLSIAERRDQRKAIQPNVSVGGREVGAEQLKATLDIIKKVISDTIGDRKTNIAMHQQFVRSIHGLFQLGKTSRRVDYFVLNYDTLIEDALGLERIAYSDGFAGAATGWWEPSTFNDHEKSTRIFKIHGSIDWCLLKGDQLPRRIRPGIKTETDEAHVLIYPAGTKYKEAQRDPFAHMLTYFQQSLEPAEDKEMVLAICGYSFGDPHIDLEIERALIQSNARLTVLAFIEDDEPTGKLKGWLENSKINNQILVYAKKGIFHGNEKHIQDCDLPWWRFEILSRLLGGER